MTTRCMSRCGGKRALLLVQVVILLTATVTYQSWWSPSGQSGIKGHNGHYNRHRLTMATGSTDQLFGDAHRDGAIPRGTFNDMYINNTKTEAKVKLDVFESVKIVDKPESGKTSTKSGRKCKPKSNIVFLKTHKTAGTTVQNILIRYGLAKNLTFVLPYEGFFLGFPHYFTKSAVLQERLHSNRTTYNILCHHRRFHYGNIRELMANDTIYITIVRNPVDMFESAFHYYRFGPRYHIAQPNDFKAFLDKPSYYVDNFGEKRFSHNALFYDLGYDNANLTSERTIKSIITQIDQTFSIVMVADYFEESTILLKHALCWDIDDVTFFRVNSRKEKSTHQVTTDMAKKIRQWNKADAMLFEHFNKTLWLKLSRLPKTWRKEVEELRERNQQLNDACVKADSATSDQIEEKTFQGFQPAEISINGFILKEKAKNNVTCQRMVTPEVPFTAELRERELRKYNISKVNK